MTSSDNSKVRIWIESNVNPRVEHVQQAVASILKLSDIKIVDSSFLYTDPESLSEFVGGSIQIETLSCNASGLLENLKATLGSHCNFVNVKILPNDDLITESRTLDPYTVLATNEINSKFFSESSYLRSDTSGLLRKLFFKNASCIQRILPIPSLTIYPFGNQPRSLIMGILNLSPDSFSEPGLPRLEDAVALGLKMESEGADLIDIGAVSRRPGSTEDMSPEEEGEKLAHVIQNLRQAGLRIPISVDVVKASVAETALKAGANIINDTGMGVRDSEMLRLAAKTQAPIILMHTRGSPLDMNSMTDYPTGIVAEVSQELSHAVKNAMRMGIPRWNIILDPGIGFAKTGKQNMEFLRGLKGFKESLGGFPILIGLSRKRFIGNLTGVKQPTKRLMGSIVGLAAAISEGADILRVHDVKESIQAARFADAFWKEC